jgi:hypothetical protein
MRTSRVQANLLDPTLGQLAAESLILSMHR